MIEILDGILIVRVSEELDQHNADLIRKEVDETIKKQRIVEIIFDFQKTTFMDSSGIGMVMGRFKLVNSIGGSVAVVNLCERVKKIFTFSGLTKIVNQYENVEEALQIMKGEGDNE